MSRHQQQRQPEPQNSMRVSCKVLDGKNREKRVSMIIRSNSTVDAKQQFKQSCASDGLVLTEKPSIKIESDTASNKSSVSKSAENRPRETDAKDSNKSEKILKLTRARVIVLTVMIIVGIMIVDIIGWQNNVISILINDWLLDAPVPNLAQLSKSGLNSPRVPVYPLCPVNGTVNTICHPTHICLPVYQPWR